VSVAFVPAIGVGQPAVNFTADPRFNAGPRRTPVLSLNRRFRANTVSGSVSGSVAQGVGHPEQSLPDMRRPAARSAQIGTPAGISCVFQVRTYSGEPLAPINARNLFSKDNWRLALFDEAVKSGPEVSFVGMAFALSSARKRLTGT
jgi:hypothetical protein